MVDLETITIYFEYIRLSGLYNMMTEPRKVIWEAISLFVYTSDLPDTEFPQIDGILYHIILNGLGKEPYTSQASSHIMRLASIQSCEALSLPGGPLYMKAKDKYEDTEDFIREVGPMVFKLEEARDYFVGLAKEARKDGDRDCMTTNDDYLLQQGIRIHSDQILEQTLNL